MDKRSEYLQTLGLGPDAAWDEVTQTYKDLMRIWHPDRFPSDERLRKKAEQESQRINHAMTELKKLGKVPPRRNTQAPPRSPYRHTTQEHEQHTTQQHRHQATQRQHTQTQPNSNARPAEDLSHATFSYVIQPLKIRQKPFNSIIRTAFAALVFYATFT